MEVGVVACDSHALDLGHDGVQVLDQVEWVPVCGWVPYA